MGQLIKLQDYASRYEENIFHYPSRFVLLKKQQWDKIRNLWENPPKINFHPQYNEQHLEWMEEEEEKQHLLGKIKRLFKRKKDRDNEAMESDAKQESDEDEDTSPFVEMDFFSAFSHRPETVAELKQLYLNQLFDFQMKWATSTLTERSYINKKFYYDEHLKYLLQRFPDTYFVMYQPIFLLKKAPVEVECILISPTDVWCITFLEEHDLSVFIGSNDRFWPVRNQNRERKILNPMISLNRTEKIVKTIFKVHEIDLPIHKVLLSRNGYIDYPAAPYDVKLIEKRNYEEWFQALRSLRSPLKYTQLKGTKALLQYCQTTSIRRLEWEVTEGK